MGQRSPAWHRQLRLRDASEKLVCSARLAKSEVTRCELLLAFRIVRAPVQNSAEDSHGMIDLSSPQKASSQQSPAADGESRSIERKPRYRLAGGIRRRNIVDGETELAQGQVTAAPVRHAP